jgi:hypothetical protein
MTTAVIKIAAPSAVYTGLTMDQISGSTALYGANALGSIDVYDTNLNPVTLAAGACQDPMIPSGFTPYNVQNLEAIFLSPGRMAVSLHPYPCQMGSIALPVPPPAART